MEKMRPGEMKNLHNEANILNRMHKDRVITTEELKEATLEEIDELIKSKFSQEYIPKAFKKNVSTDNYNDADFWKKKEGHRGEERLAEMVNASGILEMETDLAEDQINKIDFFIGLRGSARKDKIPVQLTFNGEKFSEKINKLDGSEKMVVVIYLDKQVLDTYYQAFLNGKNEDSKKKSANSIIHLLLSGMIKECQSSGNNLRYQQIIRMLKTI